MGEENISLELQVKMLLAPVVLSKPEEYSPIPNHLKELVLKSRIESFKRGDFNEGLASEGDLVVHLMDASFKFPLPEKYVKIYSFYANKLLGGALEKAGIKVYELTDYEEEEARRLRRKIFQLQLSHVRKLRKIPKPIVEIVVDLIRNDKWKEALTVLKGFFMVSNTLQKVSV